MKQLTLLLALFAFLAAGCADEPEVEPADDVDVVVPEVTVPDVEAEMDTLGATLEEGAEDAAGAVEEGAEEVQEEVDGQ